MPALVPSRVTIIAGPIIGVRATMTQFRVRIDFAIGAHQVALRGLFID